MRALLLLVLVATPAFAASGGAPVTLPHSGFVVDGVDAPVTNAAASFTFRLFVSASATTPEWSATCAVAVSAGYFATTLGAGACAGDGLDTADLPTGQQRFLEVEYGGVKFAPRLALNALPAAALAADAERLGGVLASAYVKATDAIAASTVGGQSLAQLDARYARFGASPAQAGSLAITGAITATTLAGDGAAVTNVDAAKIGGQTLTGLDGRYAKLSATPPTAQVGHLSVSGSISAASFSGNGANVTNVDAARLGGKTLAEIQGYALVDSSTGSCAGKAGAIRWTGSTFEGCDGTSWRRFAYQLGVTGVSPATGPAGGGTTITITGAGFASGAQVRVGGTLATGVTFVSGTQITAVTPAFTGSLAPTDVRVTNASGESASLSGAFTYAADGTQSQYALASCKAIRDAFGVAATKGSTTYWIDPDGAAATISAYQVWCDMGVDGGGWTLIESLTRDHAINGLPASGAAWYVDVPTNEANPGMNGSYRMAYARLNALRNVATELAATTENNGFTKDYFRSVDARNKLYNLGDDSGATNYKNIVYEAINVRGTTWTNRTVTTWMRPTASGWSTGGHQTLDDAVFACSSCDYFGFNSQKDPAFSGHLTATSKTHYWLR